jgi:16S rRNA (adenine1518-N6/adenine1519-N6)-dimethyltransferase
MADSPDPKKSLGQHWLNDQPSLEAMCNAAELHNSDTVLEIGPGPGSLTELLVRRSKKVVAVELDAKLAAELPKRINADNLEVVEKSILKLNFNELPTGYKLVANIPYYLTGQLLRVISETDNPPSIAALLIQKEVAERAAAKPGQMSLLSVTAQFYWQVSLGKLVGAELFQPPPKVDSQILVLQRRAQPLFEVEEGRFFRIVKAGFSQRRKTLLNSLSAGLGRSKETTKLASQKAGIDPDRRAQTLSLEEWYKLYQTINA